jgi:hypothetical protein
MITLTANLETIIGGAESAGWLRITLCGFGPVLPSVPGTCMLADAGVPQLVGPQVGSTPISVQLYGNDVITPSSTFYEVAVLDANQNVVQCGNYKFTGSGTYDLSNAVQLVQPLGFQPGGLQYSACTGAVPGTVYTASGPVIAVSYNGIFMRANQASPALSYTVSGETITLNFSTQAGDRIDAICIVHP